MDVGRMALVRPPFAVTLVLPDPRPTPSNPRPTPDPRPTLSDPMSKIGNRLSHAK